MVSILFFLLTSSQEIPEEFQWRSEWGDYIYSFLGDIGQAIHF